MTQKWHNHHKFDNNQDDNDNDYNNDDGITKPTCKTKKAVVRVDPPIISQPVQFRVIDAKGGRHHNMSIIISSIIGNHRENGGTLGMVPLIINSIYNLYSGYLLGTTIFPVIQHANLIVPFVCRVKLYSIWIQTYTKNRSHASNQNLRVWF